MVANLRLEDWQVVHQRLRGIAKRQRALDAEEAQCLRAAFELQLWRPLGYVHMAEYLERELGYGPQVGAERVRVARALAELPKIEASLSQGGLAYSAVRELTRVATSDTEQAWLEAAQDKSLRQIEGLVAGRKRGDRPEDPSEPALIRRVIQLELSPAAFALLRQAQSALAAEQGGQLDDSALVELLCRRALEPGNASERPAHQIAFTVCESCERAWQNGAGREIEVSSAVLERARCDADWIGSVHAERPARATSTVTPRTRRQVFARDHQRCMVPGCRSSRNLDLHHIQYQQDGGGHELSNITVLCSGHHQQLHDGALEIRGTAPDALTFAWTARDAIVSAPAREADRTAMPAAIQVGTATDGTASGRTASGGTATDGTATDGTWSGETASGGTASGGTASGGTATDGTASSGTASGRTASGGTATDGTASGRTARGGTATDGTASGRTATDGTATGGTAIGGTESGGAASGGTASGGTASGRTASGGKASGGTARGGKASSCATCHAAAVSAIATDAAAIGASIDGNPVDATRTDRSAIAALIPLSLQDDGESPAVLDERARQALVGAGYSAHVARLAVAKAARYVPGHATLEARVRAALRAALDCR